MSGKLPKQWKPYVEKLEQRINELEAIENGLDDRITVLEDYITKLETKLDAVNNILTGSEAIYGFAAWLTTQKTTTTMGSTHDCAPIVDSVDTFCKVNNLSEPRENWTDFLTHPPAIGDQE